MSKIRGYYSIVQFCPDRSRLEAANVGVVLFCPDIQYLDVQISYSMKRIEKFFGKGSIDPEFFKAMLRSLESEIALGRKRLRTIESFGSYFRTLGNDIVVSHPRPVTIRDPRATLLELFKDLVGSPPARQSGSDNFPELDHLFTQERLRNRVQYDKRVTIPTIGTKIKVPYLYQNEFENLVKPKRFDEPTSARHDALRLGADGHLLWRHSVDVPVRKKLIVIAYFSGSTDPEVANSIEQALLEFDVRVVRQEQIPDFINEVVAHAKLVQHSQD